MRGPIDYIIVGFEGQKFDGSILQALSDAIDKGIINLIALKVITKDEEGTVTALSLEDLGDEATISFAQKYAGDGDEIDDDDINEMGDLLENNTAAGMLVIEQLWALPLKKALLGANGVLVAEGRIHPDSVAELESV